MPRALTLPLGLVLCSILAGCPESAPCDGYTYPAICTTIGEAVAEQLDRCDAPCPIDGIDCAVAASFACRLYTGAEQLADLSACLRELYAIDCDAIADLSGAPLCASLIGE